MGELFLHHVSLAARDVPKSVAFYKEMFGLSSVERPATPHAGAWLAAGPSLQVHIIAHSTAPFRENGIDSMENHFAFRTDDFEGFVEHARGMGFHEDAPDDDPKRLVVRRNTVFGFNQVYLLDPDR